MILVFKNISVYNLICLFSHVDFQIPFYHTFFFELIIPNPNKIHLTIDTTCWHVHELPKNAFIFNLTLYRVTILVRNKHELKGDLVTLLCYNPMS